ncbi:MAG: hypothetical protein H6619_03265 [Deltaproteobacteria bacterium]|nr:hypothetical protein [Deltaproteobacteria bacterium]
MKVKVVLFLGLLGVLVSTAQAREDDGNVIIDTETAPPTEASTVKESSLSISRQNQDIARKKASERNKPSKRKANINDLVERDVPQSQPATKDPLLED